MDCEVCIDSVQSALEAEKGGAIRVELCDNLFEGELIIFFYWLEGGTTPSAGMIFQVRKNIPNLKMHVLIRPRGGDLCYSDLEKEVMKHDIELCKSYKVNQHPFIM